MANDSEKVLDATGWALLRALQENARASYAELGRRVGLTAPAVADRMRRLEAAGIISGYHTTVDPAKLGLAVTAIIRFQLYREADERLYEAVKARPEIVDCHIVTGEDCMILTAVVSSVEHLGKVIGQLERFGTSKTAIVLSSPVEHRAIEPAALKQVQERA